MLDFTLNTQQRVELAHSMDLTTSNLETIANYILHHEDTLNPHRKYRDTPLDPNQEETLTSKYTSPKIPINYTLPEIAPIKEAINSLKEQELRIKETEPSRAYKLRLAIRELYQEAGEIFHTLRNEIKINPISQQHIPELDIDFTNPFHIKHLIEYYSDLGQTEREEAFFTILTLEYAISLAKLKPWEEYILTRSIDGAKQPTIAIEMAEKFDYLTTPSYMSQVKRMLYRRIADAFELDQKLFILKQHNCTTACLFCGKHFPTNLEHICRPCAQKIKKKQFK